MKKLTFILLFCLGIISLQAQVKPYMTEQPFTGTTEPRQGVAVYKSTLFQFHNANPLIEIYNLDTKAKLGEIRLEPEKIVHCNNANFSNEKYDKADPFPILYVSSERDQRIFAYRVTNQNGQWGVTKLQTIYLPKKEEASMYFTNLILNTGKKTLWITGYTRNSWNKPDNGNQVHYIQLKMPKISDGDVHLDYKDKISEFFLPHYTATQGAVFYKGKICQSYGITAKENFFFIINPQTGKIEKKWSMGQAGIDEEPEGAFVYKGKLMVLTCKNGNIYYVNDFKKIQ